MRYKLLITLLSLIVATGFMKAQERVDTIYNPPIVYSRLPTYALQAPTIMRIIS